MVVDNVKLVYFSPTGTTKAVLHSIAEGIGIESVEAFDITPPGNGVPEDVGPNELILVGAPVYAGRIPREAEERLVGLKGSGQPAVVVVLYGNREFDDALLELRDICEKNGFKVVAGGAFIGEHSFATDEMPIAKGRPDREDLRIAANFGREIIDGLGRISTTDALPILPLPGNSPYRPRNPRNPISPITEQDLCQHCEKCVEICPVSAIASNDRIETEAMDCILCCACIRVCPEHCRIFTDDVIGRQTKWLMDNYSVRKEPEVFIVGTGD